MAKRSLKASNGKPMENAGVGAPFGLESLASPPPDQDVAALAYRQWEKRGCPQGSPDEDWFEAQRELQSRSRSA